MKVLLLLLLHLFHLPHQTRGLLLPYHENGTSCANSSIPGCLCDTIYFSQLRSPTQGCVAFPEDLDKTCCVPKIIIDITINATLLSAPYGTFIQQGGGQSISPSIGTLHRPLLNTWTLIISNAQATISTKQGDVVDQSFILWHYDIIGAPTMTALAGVSVAQGSSSGILWEALSGSTSMVIVKTSTSVTLDLTTAELSVNFGNSG